MKRTTWFATFAFSLTSAAHAQLWVSTTGSDANPCTLASPCRTFQQAAYLVPQYGIIHVLNAGDYGPININYPLEIDGGGLASISVSGSGSAPAIQVKTTGLVRLRNISIHGYSGAPEGIQMGGYGAIDIDNVQVTGFAGNCIAIRAGFGPIDVVIKDSTIENCSSNGISIEGGAPSYNATVKVINTHVRFANGGLNVGYVTAVSAYDSTFSSPGPPTASTGTVGVFMEEGLLLLDNCEVSGFGVGVESYYLDATVQVSRSTLIDNWVAVSAPSGGVVVTNANNSFAANHAMGTFTSTVALQ